MELQGKWYFTKEQLENTPSRKRGLDGAKELSYRQHTAKMINEMGKRLRVSQLCINTAIVYMHRFYIFHPFTLFHRNAIAAAAVLLATKTEEQRRRLEHVVKVAYSCLYGHPRDMKASMYNQLVNETVGNENLLLQTLGFDLVIEHPHTHVVSFCEIVRASTDLGRAAYCLATHSLHLTTMSLEYKPSVVACFCIHLACKWLNLKVPQPSEGKEWYRYIDESVTQKQVEQLTTEFLTIFEKCPTQLKHKIKSTIISSENLDENNELNLKRRRVDSPSADDRVIEEIKQLGTGFLANSSNYLVKEVLPNTSKHLGTDIAEPQRAIISRENYFKKPSAHSSSHINCDSLPETSSRQTTA